MNAYVLYALYCALTIIPMWRLLPRYGWPAYAAIMAAFPLLLIGMLWLMAFDDKFTTGKAGRGED